MMTMTPLLGARLVRTILILPMQFILVSTQQCQLLDSTSMLSGKYCPVNGVKSVNALPRHCRAICLQTQSCAAYNYNITDNTCTRLTATCPLAKSNPVMEFGKLIAKKNPDCHQWIPFTRGDPRDERMVSPDDSQHRTVARTVSAGAEHFGYYHEPQDACYVATSSNTSAKMTGYPCQRLRIAEGCTAFWAPYAAGNPLPSNAFIGGKIPMAITFMWQAFTRNLVITHKALSMGWYLRVWEEWQQKLKWSC